MIEYLGDKSKREAIISGTQKDEKSEIKWS